MTLLRLLLYGILFYLGYKLLKEFFKKKASSPKVQGRARNPKPLDLNDVDIEDADYEEIDEK